MPKKETHSLNHLDRCITPEEMQDELTDRDLLISTVNLLDKIHSCLYALVAMTALTHPDVSIQNMGKFIRKGALTLAEELKKPGWRIPNGK